eukprot:8795120-Alexandrium_andersonii.AAC.1
MAGGAVGQVVVPGAHQHPGVGDRQLPCPPPGQIEPKVGLPLLAPHRLAREPLRGHQDAVFVGPAPAPAPPDRCLPAGVRRAP